MTEKRDALNRALAEISRQKAQTREKISALRKKTDDLREKAPEYRDLYISAWDEKDQKKYLEKYERAVQEIRTADEISRELSAGRVYYSEELRQALEAVKAECMEIMDRISKETEADAEKITQALEAIEEAGRQSRENNLFLEAYMLDVVNMVHTLNGERSESTLRLVALDEMELSGDPIREAIGAAPAKVARVRSVARFCEYTAPEVEELTQRARTSL